MKFVLVGVDPSKMAISSPDDDPAALALNERVQAVCRFAREHVIDVRVCGDSYSDPDPRHVLTAGPLRCTFLHVVTPKGEPLRYLSIALAGARGLDDMPPPVVCAVIAKMFGFTGDIFDDYSANPSECGCGKPGCEALGITCTQSMMTEN